MSFSSSRAKSIFGVKEEYDLWAIEWQTVTGRLLMVSSKTREFGEEKLRDAQERIVEMKEEQENERSEGGEESDGNEPKGTC